MIEYKKELVHNALGRPYWIYKDDTFYQQRIAGAGPYQQKNLKYIRALVPEARTIIDVGMNIGMNTIEYATWADEVKSFEPVIFQLYGDPLPLDISVSFKSPST